MGQRETSHFMVNPHLPLTHCHAFRVWSGEEDYLGDPTSHFPYLLHSPHCPQVIDEKDYLGDLNIQIIKRIVPRVKGVRLRRSAFLTVMQQAAYEEEAHEGVEELLASRSRAGSVAGSVAASRVGSFTLKGKSAYP